MGLHACTCTLPILASLLAQMSGAPQPIEVIVDTNIKEEIQENRKKLAPVVHSVLFCSRLGLPLCAHHEKKRSYNLMQNKVGHHDFLGYVPLPHILFFSFF